MPTVRIRRAVLLGPVLAVLFIGFGADRLGAAQIGCLPATSSPDVRLSVKLRDDNALIADAVVELPRPASTYLEYGNDQVGWLRTPTLEATTAAVVPLVRLRAETDYEVRAFAIDAAGCPERVKTARVASGPLPAVLEQRFSTVEGIPSVPLYLVDHRLPRPQGTLQTGMLAIFDDAGRLVWYFVVPNEITIVPGLAPGLVIRELPNGNLIYQVFGYGFHEITRDGRSVRLLPLPDEMGPRRTHHDFVVRPDGTLIFLTKQDLAIAPRPDAATVTIRGDALATLDPASDDIRIVWSAFDHLDPDLRPPHWDELDEKIEDWTHANSIWFGPRGNVVLSLRHLDQIISLSPDLSRVEWKLGGLDSSFTFPDPTDRFGGQHDAKELSGNRILLFDNGNYRPEGEYSRGLELELDFGAMTARKIWEYRPQPDLYTPIVGSVDRLPNGNTLLNYGYFPIRSEAEGPAKPLLTIEARPDGTSAWHHRMAWERSRGSRYRVLPLETVAGERPVDPTPIAASIKQ